jgi:hypothetical protein
MKSIEVWAKQARLLSFKLLRLIVDGPEALGIVHEHGQILANNNEYDVYVAKTSGSKAARSRTIGSIGTFRRSLRPFETLSSNSDHRSGEPHWIGTV